MARLPSKDEVLDWIAANPGKTAKRDIAKAFGIKGADRIDLKRILKGLEEDGHLEKRRKTYRDPDKLPPVSVLQVTGPNQDGDLFARPLEWQGEVYGQHDWLRLPDGFAIDLAAGADGAMLWTKSHHLRDVGS